MPPPTDLTETRKFLGFVGYYRKFIPKYSDIAHPLTNLTRKDIPIEWSKACQAAFEMLSGLNRIDFPTSRKVDAVDPFG